MRRRIRLIASVGLIFLAACGDDDPAGPGTAGEPASLRLSTSVVVLAAVGEEERLSATVRDAGGDAVEDAAVEWTSGDEAVATVDSVGRVVAQTNGTAKITAAAGDVVDADGSNQMRLTEDAAIDVRPAWRPRP